MSVFRLAIWDFSGRLANYVVLFGTSIVLARLLEPADYGAFGIVVAVFTIAGVFLDVGFRSAIVQAVELTTTQLSTIFFLNTGLAILISLLISVAAGPIERFYELGGLSKYLIVTSLAFIVNGLTAVPSGLLQRNLLLRQITVVNILSAIASSTIAIVMALRGFGVWSLVASQLTNAIGLAIGCFLLAGWSPSLSFDLPAVRPLWSFGSKLFASALLDTVYSRLDGFIVPKSFGVVTYGFYSRAQSLDLMVRQFSTSTIISVIFPVFSRNQKNENLPDLYKRSLEFVSFVVLAITGALVVTARNLITVLFSEKWAESAGFYQIIAVSTFVFPLSALMVNLLAARGKSKLYLALEVTKKAILSPTYLFLFFGAIYGFLIAQLGANLLCLLTNIIFVSREIHIRISEQVRAIGTYVTIALASGCLAHFAFASIEMPVWAQLVAQGAAYELTYLLMNYFLNTAGLNELFARYRARLDVERNPNLSSAA